MGYTNLSFYRSKMMGTPNRMTTRPTGKRLKSSTEPTSCRFERSKIDSLLSKKWEILGYATTCFLLITMLAPVDATNQFQRDMETHGINARRRLGFFDFFTNLFNEEQQSEECTAKKVLTCKCGKARRKKLRYETCGSTTGCKGWRTKGNRSCSECHAAPWFGKIKGYIFKCTECKKYKDSQGECKNTQKLSERHKTREACREAGNCEWRSSWDMLNCKKCEWRACQDCILQSVDKAKPLAEDNVTCRCGKATRHTTYKECGTCNGSGQKWGVIRNSRCTDCYGTGEAYLSDFGCSVCRKAQVQVQKKCSKCNWNDASCDACGGTRIAMMLGCRECNWDACPDCMLKTNKAKKVQNRPKSIGDLEAKERQNRLDAGRRAEEGQNRLDAGRRAEEGQNRLDAGTRAESRKRAREW